jgi:hypothetical protein
LRIRVEYFDSDTEKWSKRASGFRDRSARAAVASCFRRNRQIKGLIDKLNAVQQLKWRWLKELVRLLQRREIAPCFDWLCATGGRWSVRLKIRPISSSTRIISMMAKRPEMPV